MSMKNDQSIPRSFIIDVNWDCNLKCKMCVKRTLKHPYGQRTFEDFETLVEKLPFAHAIKMGALGDPFSYKDVSKLLVYLKGKNVQLPLTTNITQITKSNLNKIPQGVPLYMSIDSGEVECYKKIRGADLDSTLSKVEMIKETRPDIPLTFNYLMFNFNLDSAIPLMDFCKDKNIGMNFFYPIYFTKELEEEWSIFRDPKYVVSMAKVMKHAETNNVKFNMTSPYHNERPCMRAFQEPIVAFDGTVYPCDYCYQNMNDYKEWNSWYLGEPNEVPQHEYAMGNLYEQEFIEMWNSDKWIRLREKLYYLNRVGTGKTYEQVKKENKKDYDNFSHCEICHARWGICL